MKRFLITGGSSGIGLSICQNLLTQDTEYLVNISRRPCPLSDERIQNISMDFSQPKAADKSLKTLARDQADLDALILCAGQGRFRMLEEFTVKDITEMMDINFTSHAVLLKHFLPGLKKRNRGKIVLIGSESAVLGGKKGSLYCASKFALRGLAQSLRQECARNNITISLINPGMVKSPFFDQQSFRPGPEPENSIEPQEVANLVMSILRSGPGSNIDEINLSPLKKVIDFSSTTEKD